MPNLKGIQRQERWDFVTQKQRQGYTYAQIAPLLNLKPDSLRVWMAQNRHKYADPPNSSVNHQSNHPANAVNHQPLIVNNDDIDLNVSREVKLKMIQDQLFEMVLKGEVTKKEFLEISKELRYWREHEERYGAIEAETETVSLDLADLDYVLAHVEEVICPACPYRRRAIQDARTEQETARLLSP